MTSACGVPAFDPTGKTCTSEITCPDGFHCALPRVGAEGTCQPGERASVVAPGPDDTGVPAGVSLTRSGGLSIDVPGTVIENLDIEGCVVINANDVVIRRSRIRCTGLYVVRVFSGHSGVVLEDVEIDGMESADTKGLVGGPVTLRRINLHSVTQALIPASGSRYERLYIHDVTTSLPLIQSNQSSDVTFTGCSFHAAADAAAVLLKASQGAIGSFRFEGNWFLSGARALSLDASTFGMSGISVTDNRFARGVDPVSINGAVALQWAGNVWDDTGETIPAP